MTTPATTKPKPTAATIRQISKPRVKPKLRDKPDRGVLSVAEQRALTRWHKPLPAILAEALAVNQSLLDRLDVGVYGPNQESKEQYQIVLNGLYHATQQQQEALEIFGEVDWSEGE
jgi:hypothetical protein